AWCSLRRPRHSKIAPARITFEVYVAETTHRNSVSRYRCRCGRLRVDSAHLQGTRHAVDCQHVGRDAVVHVVRFRITHNLVESTLHDVEQALVHFLFAQKEALAVLYPLEVADRPPAGIAQDIRHGEHALTLDDGVRLPRRRAVRSLTEHSRLDLR